MQVEELEKHLIQISRYGARRQIHLPQCGFVFPLQQKAATWHGACAQAL